MPKIISYNNKNIRADIKFNRPHLFYSVRDCNDQLIDFKKANGRLLYNHLRHNCTNYDAEIKRIRKKYFGGAWLDNELAKEIDRYTAEIILEKTRDISIRSANKLASVIEERSNLIDKLSKIFKSAGTTSIDAIVTILVEARSLIDSPEETHSKLIELIEKNERSYSISRGRNLSLQRDYRFKLTLNRQLLKQVVDSTHYDETILEVYDEITKANGLKNAIKVYSDFTEIDDNATKRILKKLHHNRQDIKVL